MDSKDSSKDNPSVAHATLSFEHHVKPSTAVTTVGSDRQRKSTPNQPKAKPSRQTNFCKRSDRHKGLLKNLLTGCYDRDNLVCLGAQEGSSVWNNSSVVDRSESTYQTENEIPGIEDISQLTSLTKSERLNQRMRVLMIKHLLCSL